MNPQAAFGLLALLLAAATLCVLLPGLWKGAPPARARGVPDAPAMQGDGVAILREQLAAVDRDMADARIDPATADRLRAEIGRRLLEEREGAASVWHEGPARGVAVSAAVGVPLLALALYTWIGTPAALTQAPRTGPSPQASATQVEAMASQMLQALEARDRQGASEPGDAQAWAMVGRTLASLQRFAEAERALARALALRPDDPSLLADRADLLALLQGTAEGEPLRLIAQALRLAPDHPKALALVRQHMPQARTPTQAQAQGQAAGQTSPRIAAPTLRAPSIQGGVTLAPALQAQVQPDDTVFIVARAAQGPRMPLAILRLRVADLPARFTLNDEGAMDPALRLSRFDQVVVTARVSRGGEALPRSGDAVGEPVNASLGARDVSLRIDRLQP